MGILAEYAGVSPSWFFTEEADSTVHEPPTWNKTLASKMASIRTNRSFEDFSVDIKQKTGKEISPAILREYETDPNVLPRKDIVEILAKYVNVEPVWFYYKDKENFSPAPPDIFSFTEEELEVVKAFQEALEELPPEQRKKKMEKIKLAMKLIE